MVRKRVVLPAPLAPMMATVSPGLQIDVDAVERLEVAVESGQRVGREQAHTGEPR